VHSIDSHVFGADDALFVDAIAQMLAIAADRLRAFAAWEQSLRP
jgi:GAF domain-containing protein